MGNNGKSWRPTIVQILTVLLLAVLTFIGGYLAKQTSANDCDIDILKLDVAKLQQEKDYSKENYDFIKGDLGSQLKSLTANISEMNTRLVKVETLLQNRK